MSWTVRQITTAGLTVGIFVDLDRRGTHSYPVRADGRIAAVACHDGLNTEITNREIRKMCKRLEKDPDELFRALNGK